MGAKKPRIETNPMQTGLNAAFSGLNLPDLPEAPLPVAPDPKPEAKQRSLGGVVLRREKAHRGGKTVVVVDDFGPHIRAEQIEALARKLRAACGAGGTVAGRTIEVQGDQPARVRAVLEGEGFRVAGV